MRHFSAQNIIPYKFNDETIKILLNFGFDFLQIYGLAVKPKV